MACGNHHVDDLLYDFYQAITRWALRRGRAGVFAASGLGQDRYSIDGVSCWWLHRIVAPLCVAEQTELEAKRFRIPMFKFVRDASQFLWPEYHEL